MKQIILLLLVIFSYGCASLIEPPPPAGSWEAHRQQIEPLQQWSLEAQIGLKTSEESLSGRMSWTQSAQGYALQIRDPLGREVLQLSQQGALAKLVIKEQRWEGQDAEALLLAHTGWKLPLAQLPLWLRGLPGASETYSLGSDNHLATLSYQSQYRWLLAFNEYQHIAPYTLPYRLKVNGPDVTIKLVITHWDLPA